MVRCVSKVKGISSSSSTLLMKSISCLGRSVVSVDFWFVIEVALKPDLT